MKRPETILVLPYNTLRIVDLCVQMEIYAASDEEISIEETIHKLLCRKDKDLGKLNKINSEIVNNLMDKYYPSYYKVAPMTIVYDLLAKLKCQKFVNKIIALHKYQGTEEPLFDNAYYDGSIEELEKFIKNNSITAIIMDDIHILYELVSRENVDVRGMTFFISKMGYNLEIVNDKFQMLYNEYLTDKMDELNFQFCLIGIYQFKQETIDSIKNKK